MAAQFTHMNFEPFQTKMEAAGLGAPAIRSFKRCYRLLAENHTGLIPESEMDPVENLFRAAEVAQEPADASLIGRTALLKLNGGLGTSMGLERAKSLLEVRPGVTFLDLIARQVQQARARTGADLRFLLLNSFSTSEDTRAWLAKHPELGDPATIELLQNKVPKVDASSLAPAVCPENPALEWCPPGHGDIYTVLGTGDTMERLLSSGIEFLFVSNSDNLGATLDPGILAWFARSGAPFAMEVTARTESDRKGGHLARRGSGLLLRESAQCPDEDMDAFQDINRHRYFNTNNLWLRLNRLQEALEKNGGFLPLPLIRNRKTLDPRDKKSPAVYQLETAMGAAIECFPDAAAIEVPRERFAPVKTTSDLFALRSDAYELGEDGAVRLASARNSIPPRVELDETYKLVDQLEAALPGGAPSLMRCDRLVVTGTVQFSSDVIFEGEVTVRNRSSVPKPLPPGTYRNTVVDL
jgi:UTP--glucose-1-phosphate uridylyltransferase